MAAALDQLADEVVAGRGALRLAALATIAGHEPQVRNVIIRRFTQPHLSLIFFCRADDAKFGEIASHPAVELVCYERHPDRQIRLAGTAASITDAALLDTLWSEVSPLARRDYVLAVDDGETASRHRAVPGGDPRDSDAAQNEADRERAAIISSIRAPLFRAVEVTIRRVKLLTFAEDRWIPHTYLPSH
jgi:hypothetical protein